MTIKTEVNHAGEFLVSDAGKRSREKVIVVTGQVLAAGAVLGRILAAQNTVVFTGTGNGVFTMDVTTPLLAGAQEGRYTAICTQANTNAGVFEVYDPAGIFLGKHNVGGAAFANQIKFAIADGATDFIAGDQFEIYIYSATSAYTGTGNGTLTVRQTSEGAQVGAYALLCTAAATNAGTFSVTAPDGTSLGNATVGVAFTGGGLDFTLNDGSTDFIVGDKFTLTVTRGKVKAFNPANTDGSAYAFGVLYDAVDATSADMFGAAVVRQAEVNSAELQWAAGLTGAQQQSGRTQLAARGVISR